MSFMYVKIHYGPSNHLNVYDHNPQRLKGLRVALQNLGMRVDLVPISHLDVCIIEMCGYEVFRCNIKSMLFNKCEMFNPVCQLAVDCVKEAVVKMQRARMYLWAWMLIENAIFTCRVYRPKNYWSLDAEFKPLRKTCADCCNIPLAGSPKLDVPEKFGKKYLELHQSY